MEHHNANVINESPVVVTSTAVAPTSGNLTTAIQKEGTHRFSWGYKVMYENCEDYKVIYHQHIGSGRFPFLNDANVKDSIFTKRLCIDTPFVGSQSQQNLKWKKLHGILLEILDGNQKQIFEYLTLQTMKNRFKRFEKLTQHLLDEYGGADVEHSDSDARSDLHRCEYATENLTKYISYNVKTLMKLLPKAKEPPHPDCDDDKPAALATQHHALENDVKFQNDRQIFGGSSNKRSASLTKPSAAAIPLILDMDNVESDSTQVGQQQSSKKMKPSSSATTCGGSMETTITTAMTSLTQKKNHSASSHASGVSNTTTPIDRSMGLDTIQNWNVTTADATAAGGGGGCSTNDQLATFGTNILYGITKLSSGERQAQLTSNSGKLQQEQAASAYKTACEDIKTDSDGSGGGNSSRHQSTTIATLSSPSPSPSLQSRSEITNAAEGKTLQQQLLDMKTELKDYQMTLHAVKQDEKDTKRLQQEIIYLEDANKKLQLDARILNNSMSNLHEKYSALQEDNKVLFNIAKEQQATIAENEQLEQKNFVLEDANKKLQLDAQSLNNTLSDLQVEYSSLRQSNVTLKIEKTALHNETLGQKAMIATNRRLQQEKVVLEDANNNLRLDARTLNDTMSNLRREHSALQQSNATLQQKHSTLSASYDMLQRNHEELNVANERTNQNFENQQMILEKEMGANEFRLTKINKAVTALQKLQVELHATEENLSLSYDTLMRE